MKTIFTAIALFVISFSSAFCDLYIKEEVKSESWSDGKMIEMKVLGTNESWVSDKRMKTVETDKVQILDLSKNSYLFASNKTKAYVETSLPLDLTKFLSDELQEIRKTIKTTGDVEETSQTMTICGKLCKLYKVTYWNSVSDEVKGKVEIEVWATTDVNVIFDAYYTLISNQRTLYNRDEKLMAGLAKIKGIQMKIVAQFKDKDVIRKVTSEVQSIESKEPDATTYSIGSDYTKKDKLEPADLK